MGKKKGKSKNNTNKQPFISICTPTYNRRPFISAMIKCFEHQTYPKDKMEWIIIDDGTDKIEDLVSHIPQVKYFKYDEKMVLGKKRNLLHEKSCGDILYIIPQAACNNVWRQKLGLMSWNAEAAALWKDLEAVEIGSSELQ